MSTSPESRSLDQQREEFKKRRFLAMPLAGTVAYLGMFFSKFTGENFLDKSKPKNAFMSLFMQTIIMSLLVYAIAIPFFMIDHSSLPLTVGVLSGIMWVPMTWSIQHWAPMAHGIARTVLITAAWYVFPEQRFVVIPFLIVGLYIWIIAIMEKRYKEVNAQ